VHLNQRKVASLFLSKQGLKKKDARENYSVPSAATPPVATPNSDKAEKKE
jgi:hypothetical protein